MFASLKNNCCKGENLLVRFIYLYKLQSAIIFPLICWKKVYFKITIYILIKKVLLEIIIENKYLQIKIQKLVYLKLNTFPYLKV